LNLDIECYLLQDHWHPSLKSEHCYRSLQPKHPSHLFNTTMVTAFLDTTAVEKVRVQRRPEEFLTRSGGPSPPGLRDLRQQQQRHHMVGACQ
jgi:hypothetical protein